MLSLNHSVIYCDKNANGNIPGYKDSKMNGVPGTIIEIVPAPMK